MKMYIITDMEGAAGIAVWGSQPGIPYEVKKAEWMTAEVQAAVTGMKECGADEIIVAESHRLILDQLDQAVKVVLTGGTMVNYLPGLDASVDGVFIIGQHAMAGTGNGVLNHTGNSAIRRVMINGITLGELGFEMAYAGSLDVPVLFVSGDNATVNEAQALVKNMETVAVKEGINKYQTISLHPAQACEYIRQGAAKAVKRIQEIKPFVIEPPYTYEVEFTTTHTVSKMCLIPGVTKVNDTTVSFTSDNFQEIANIYILQGHLYDAE